MIDNDTVRRQRHRAVRVSIKDLCHDSNVYLQGVDWVRLAKHTKWLRILMGARTWGLYNTKWKRVGESPRTKRNKQIITYKIWTLLLGAMT
jgi:hypothetical protein